MGVKGKIFWENSLWSLDFATTDAQQRTKYNARIKYNAFWFRREKSTLRIKIQRWFFYMMSTNVSPLGISKKNRQNLFWILTYKLLFAKNRVVAHFRRRQVEARANNFRRFEKSNLKGHCYSYLWEKFKIFSLINNCNINRAKRKEKKNAF